MTLSINPLAKLVSSVSESITKATNEAQASLPSVSSSLSKANLDSKISQLSGEIGSGLNGLTGSISGGLAGAQGLVNKAGAALTSSGMGGIASTVQSQVGGAISKLQSVAGSTSNVAADITGSLNKLAGGNLAGGLMGLAGSISSAAGMINNVLSLKRGANLPSGAEAFIKQGQAIKLEPGAKNDWRVRITCQWNIFNSPLFKLLEETGGVVWPYLPSITVSTKAEYDSKSLIHSNYQIHSYKGSSVDDITITGDFTCETETDAAYWIAATTFFKTSTKMFFGQGEFAGNPPLICNLTGYGASIFDKVPVIIKSFSVDLKDDVNYIRCNTFGTNTWVPVLSTVTVVVTPVYNRQRMRKFNLQDYSRGKLAGSTDVGYL
jgi:hypothetical protein